VNAVEEAIQELKSRPAGYRCKEVKALLAKFGFKVVEGKSGGHVRYSHPQLRQFLGGNFDCGHKRNTDIKPAYTRNIAKVLEEYKDELLKVMGDER